MTNDQKVEERTRALQGLIEINKGIAALVDREVLLPRIAEEARRLLGMDGANFRLIEGDDLVLVAESRSEKLAFLPRLRVGESLSGKIIRENRVVVVKDVLRDDTIIPEHREIMRQAGYRAFLGVPVGVAGRSIGSLTLNSRQERDFTAEEIALITAFADQAAIAIHNAELFAEVKRKTAELEKVNEELRQASRAKSDFVAALSHEVRTPLNVIVGNADLMRDGFFGAVTESQKEALTGMLRYAQALLRLVDNLLKVARLEAKRLGVEVCPFRVEEVLAHARTYVEQLNRDGRLEVLWDVQPNLPPVTSDPLKLEEILQNLIGNAYKFTPQGRIEIRVRDLGKQGRIEFSVADTGIGIPREDRDRIFEQFHQLKGPHGGNSSGVGLGLTIVKRYLDLMQGDIRVESEPGKGSIFTFTLPYSIGAAPE